MKPQVSILIPVYNREHLIIETLESIRSQSFLNWECILVDDHSTDNSVGVISEFISQDSRFKLYQRPSEKLKGANACRNYGFEMSQGEFVNWFDSDDIMHPEFISKKVAALSNNNTLDGIISKTMMFENNIENITGRENRTFLTENVLEDFLKLKISWYLPDIMWNSAFLKEKQLFDEELLAGQDSDFYARMLIEQPKLEVVNEYLTYYRKHPQNITSHIDNRKNARLKISHLHSVIRLIVLLEKNNRLSNDLKLHFFKAMMKYLPFVISNKQDLKALFRLLRKLSFLNLEIFIRWIKVFLAYFSLKIIGKGEKILK
ncbi:glycosyltransferase family 2 protein [Flavobacterium microcysteis]|uniref:Glycosyltransferase family 2 protein n=1 Tax=Flavobacterium microcysteis TaxID=2596891 RepID=A0A501QA80_9FLAO|nr:glycosyltransferase family A protein [Flavobacterium microcysteis]TPD69809.1 glycosyltransferase family 2 protein [Flavobacterium microcysteis]